MPTKGGTRTHARAYILVSLGLALVVSGQLIASRPAIALGAIVTLAVVGDWLYLHTVDRRRLLPPLTRVAAPDPSSAGQTVRVHLLPPPDAPARLDDLRALAETLPTALLPVTTLVPAAPSRGGAATGTAALTYDTRPPRRGGWTLGPFTADLTSPLGFGQVHLTGVGTRSITVWPATAPIAARPGVLDREGRAGTDIMAQPGPDNVTVRAYSPGDDLRRIHWRSSARRGELVSRAEEPIESERVWVGLTVASTASDAARELAVSLAASWCRTVAAHGQPVELAFGGQVVHDTVPSLLTYLALATDEDLAAPLPNPASDGICVLVAALGESGTGLPRAPHGGNGQHRHRTQAAIILEGHAPATLGTTGTVPFVPPGAGHPATSGHPATRGTNGTVPVVPPPPTAAALLAAIADDGWAVVPLAATTALPDAAATLAAAWNGGGS